MGLFSGLFNNNSISDVNWNELSSSEQLNSIVQASFEKPQVVFKHSTRCGVSSMAMNRLNSEWDQLNKDVDMHYLDLLSYRKISNEIASRLGVVHQSPQIIVIVDGKVVGHGSHNQVSVDLIRSAIKN